MVEAVVVVARTEQMVAISKYTPHILGTYIEFELHMVCFHFPPEYIDVDVFVEKSNFQRLHVLRNLREGKKGELDVKTDFGF